MGLLESILSKVYKNLAPVAVPEWDCTVYVKSWSIEERYKATQITPDEKALQQDWVEPTLQIVLMSVCDESGALLFSPDNLDFLRKQDYRIVERLASAVMKHNGLTQEQDLKKNSEATNN